VILSHSIGGVVWAEVSGGETISACLQAAERVARRYDITVAFEFNHETHYTFPDGSHGVQGAQPAERKADMSKVVVKVWTFASSSGSGTYETLRYSDGSTSCSCRGWCQRVAPDGSRSCKHTRSVDMGNADVEALSFHEYGQITPGQRTISSHSPKPQPTTRTANASKKKGPGDPGYGKRKIIL